jgi:ribosomal protein L11 methyltransferase
MTSGLPTGRAGVRVAQLNTGEQVAHAIADLLADRFSGDDIAVSLSDLGGRRWQVAIYFRAAPDEDALRAAVAAAGGRSLAASLQVTRVKATDWVRASLAGLPPVAAGRFVVHGAHDRACLAVNRIGIEIEAALAFGTGHHGTTRGCLLALDRICKSHLRVTERSPQRVLDVGTGSGVLAIAAARALRTRVLATDVDADAVRIARANIRLNRMGALVETIKADGVSARVAQRGPFDVVFANILLGTLRRFAAPLRRLTAPGGRLVLSGLLPAQANAAIAAYRPLALERRTELDGWTTLVLTRRVRRPAELAQPRRRSGSPPISL